jgi:hypothetical protein
MASIFLIWLNKKCINIYKEISNSKPQKHIDSPLTKNIFII